MTIEALRLRSAVREDSPDRQFPPGADEVAISRLVDATAPRVLPQELLDLLRIMDGELGESGILAGRPPLLGCDAIVAETERRSEPDESECSPAWVVVMSAGWHFDAVLTQPHGVEHSAVLDLGYGNQDYQVAAASLTSLVAASVDLWERGHTSPIDYTLAGWQEAGKARYRVVQAAGRDADLRYAGSGEWMLGDGITPHSDGWPLSWPRPEHGDDLGEFPVERLSDFTPGMEHLAEVTIADRLGRYALVRDRSAAVWSELAPGHETGRSLGPSGAAAMSFQHVGEHEETFSRAEELLGRLPKLLRVTGVFSEAG
jgi:hypothetical protein